MYRSTCRYHVYSLGGYRALGANPSIGLCQVSRHRSAIGAMAESENATYWRMQVIRDFYLTLAVNEGYYDLATFLRRSILLLCHRVSFISPRSPSLLPPNHWSPQLTLTFKASEASFSANSQIELKIKDPLRGPHIDISADLFFCVILWLTSLAQTHHCLSCGRCISRWRRGLLSLLDIIWVPEKNRHSECALMLLITILLPVLHDQLSTYHHP